MSRYTAAEKAIRNFPFWDYGMDQVDPKASTAEWVPALAEAVTLAVVKDARIAAGADAQTALGN